MVVRCREDRKSTFPAFYLTDAALGVSKELKYLGHIISENLRDGKYIQQQCHKIYAQTTMS